MERVPRRRSDTLWAAFFEGAAQGKDRFLRYACLISIVILYYIFLGLPVPSRW